MNLIQILIQMIQLTYQMKKKNYYQSYMEKTLFLIFPKTIILLSLVYIFYQNLYLSIKLNV